MNRITANILKIAAIEAQTRDMAELEQAVLLTQPHIFTVEFDNKISKLISFSKKVYFRYANTVGKRVAAILIALFLLSSSTAFCVKEIREPLINFIVNTYEKFSSIIFDKNDQVKTLPKTIEQIFELSFAPDGYTITDIETTNTDRITIYSNKTGDEMLFEQYVIDSTRLGLDTENKTIERLVVNGTEALYLDNKGTSLIVWTQGGYGYQISGRVNKDAILNMAKSLIKQD